MNQKITSITAQKRPGRFNVFLDGNYAFSVSEEVLVKFQLSKGKELDSADLEEIFKADDLSKALNKALDYLSYSLRTEKETRQKLAKEGLEDDIIETVVKKLTKMKLLNDSEYAKSYVRTMAKTTDKGPRFIANSLKESLCKSFSANTILPSIFSSCLVMVFKIVDFPDPFGPMSVTISPCLISRQIS